MELLQKGSTFGIYTLVQCIGKGAYGIIWKATKSGSNEEFAIKLELPKKGSSLKNEADIGIEVSGSEFFAKYFEYGTFDKINYLAMELLNLNVKMYQEKYPSPHLPLFVAAKIGLSMLRCMRALHEAGFVHRDIKPENFVFRGDAEDCCLCLVDFGLSKRWRNKDGSLIPARNKVGFRGTLRYASLNSHAGLDLAPRDDLWSFFYTFIELCSAHLPWRSMTDKNSLYQTKLRGVKNSIIGLPPQFATFAEAISSLKYEDMPDYDMLEHLIQEIVEIGREEHSQDSSISLIFQYVSTSLLGTQMYLSNSYSMLVAGSVGPMISFKSTEEEEKGCCFLI